MNSVEEQLQYHYDFQQLLLNLATSFINQPMDQMDDAIVQALRQIVEFFGALRCSINQYSEDHSRFIQIYRWTSLEKSTTWPLITELATPDFVRTMAHHQHGEVDAVTNVSELPDQSEMAMFLRRFGIVALATVPILDKGDLFGFVSISWDGPKLFDAQIIGLLRLVGEIFLNVLNRKRYEDMIRGFNNDLERRIAERTSELLSVNEQLQREIERRQQIEDSLRLSEGQLRAMLDSLPIPMFVVDGQDTILYANPVSEALFGVAAEALTNRKVPDFYVNQADRGEMREVLESQGYVKDFGLPIQPVDGSIRFGLVSAQPFQFAGRSALLVAVVDVTELKQTQEAEHEHRNLTEALLDAAMALTSTLDLDAVVKHILHSVNLVVPHDVANVMILDGDEALVLGSRDRVPDNLDYKLVKSRFNYKDNYYGQLMAQSRQPLVIADITLDPKFMRIGEGPVLRAYLGIPIIVGLELIGFISLGCQAADFFTATHAKYLQIFGIQAGIAIQNARLYEQAKTIAVLEERQQLARELHDSVTQTLFSANTLAEALPRVMEQDPIKVLPYLRDLHQLTRGAMSEMRSLLVELRPETLTRTELGVLLMQLCDVFTGNTQVEVIRKINKQVILPPDIQLVFYRVAQEALNNVAKHAQATQVQIDLYSTSNVVEMRIRDNGRGFDPEGVTANHLGLKFMRERAANIQADFAVIRPIGGGTNITLKRNLP